MSRQAKAIDLNEYVLKALSEPINLEDIEELSLSTRCAIIKRILSTPLSERKFSSKISDASLIKLCKTFEISEAFHDWQRKRRQVFATKLVQKENRDILFSFKNWDKTGLQDKKQALRKSVRLHRHVYVEGITERLPYNHDFKENPFRMRNGKLTFVFGNFSGDLKTGRGQITQYLMCGEIIRDPLDAFDTAHHEGTHLIQHHLSVAFHRNQIPPSHPIHNESAYFNAVDRHKAYVPSSKQDAYRAQPHEVFAHWEGAKISQLIESLAL